MVTGEVTVENRITVSGEVHLILCDGAALTASNGITVADGNSLTIYGQAEGTGRLDAKTGKVNRAGIGGGDAAHETNAGTIIIRGGQVTASSGSGKAICLTKIPSGTLIFVRASDRRGRIQRQRCALLSGRTRTEDKT